MANNSIEDNFCPFQYFCHCSCAQFDQNVCEADCSRENLAPLPGVITKANCSLCDCSCTLFSREKCTEECAGNGRIPVVGFKDKEGCPACKCECQTQNCMLKCPGHSSKIIQDKFRCDECQCICPDVNCDENCDGPGLGIVGYKDQAGCKICDGCKNETMAVSDDSETKG